MTGIVKSLFALGFALALAVLSSVLGYEPFESAAAFYEASPFIATAWVTVVGCAVVFSILSSWYKVWVAPLLTLVLGGVTFAVLKLAGLAMPVSMTVVSVNSALVAVAILLRSEKLSVCGSSLALPGVVCFLIPVVVEVVLEVVLWDAIGSGGLIGMAVAIGLGGIFGVWSSFVLPAGLRNSASEMFGAGHEDKVMLAIQDVVKSLEEEASEHDDDPFSFPVGEAPKISVLDVKMGGIQSRATKGAPTKDKMMLED